MSWPSRWKEGRIVEANSDITCSIMRYEAIRYLRGGDNNQNTFNKKKMHNDTIMQYEPETPSNET